MTTLNLDEQESSVLKETLERILADLSYEIANTDAHDYKEQLKTRRSILQKVHDTL